MRLSSRWSRISLTDFVVALVLWMTASVSAWAQTGTVTSVRVVDEPDGSRLVIDLDTAPSFYSFVLPDPDRLVIDLKDVKLKTRLPTLGSDHPLLKGIRSAPRNQGDRRIVLDIKDGVKAKSYALAPNEQYGHRLIVELNTRVVVAAPPPPPLPVVSPPLRDIVIAIDAGHGGEDPGARGYGGTWEKNVALDIARQIAALISQEAGMRAVLVRDGDYFVSLRERMSRARREKADLFLSIHADAFNNANARGSSVYVLSDRGASDEASRWLAERENAADLVGGVSLDNKDDVLASVLLDLSQTGTLQASAQVADRVLSKIGKLGSLHSESVQSARFVVLKSPDVPSMLIETAFISNPEEELRLNDKSYQGKLSEAILDGVRDYFRSNPLPGTRIAAADSATGMRAEMASTAPDSAVVSRPRRAGKTQTQASRRKESPPSIQVSPM